jgi:hypothetical protein
MLKPSKSSGIILLGGGKLYRVRFLILDDIFVCYYIVTKHVFETALSALSAAPAAPVKAESS